MRLINRPGQRPRFYQLEGHTPVPVVGNIFTWAMAQDTAREVGRTQIGPLIISTIFTGLDTAMTGPPELFETMVFSGVSSPHFQARCDTWEKAEAQHEIGVTFARTLDANTSSLLDKALQSPRKDEP